MSRIKNVVTVLACVFAAFALMLAITGCNDDNVNNENKNAAASSNANQQQNANASKSASTTGVISTVDPNYEYASGIHHALIEVEGYDPIEVTLDADAAPVTVSNFARLASNGYYDGLTFYRFQDGFCMQGGTKGNTASGNDPTLNNIVGEFSTNGIDNPLADAFGRGVISMARSSNPDSASSTFFITMESNSSTSASLDGQYAAFGTIDDNGMKIVDKIMEDHLAAADQRNMGMVTDEAKQAVIKSITIVD